MTVIRVPSSLVPRNWRELTQRLLGGGEVIVDHYGDPTWKITALGQGKAGVLVYGYKVNQPYDDSTAATWRDACRDLGVEVWAHRFYRSATRAKDKSVLGGVIKLKTGVQHTTLVTELLLVAKVIPASPGSAAPVDVSIPAGADENLVAALRRLRVEVESTEALPQWWLLPDTSSEDGDD